MDINCAQSDEVLNIANDERLFIDRFHWLIYDQDENSTLLQHRFAEAQLYMNTELTYARPNSKLTSFILYDLYNKAKHLGGKLNITIDQQINCDEKECRVYRFLSDLHKRSRLQHRKFLTGFTFRINAVITALPISTPETQITEFLSREDDIHKDTFARFGYQTYRILRDMLDCNFKFIFRDRWTDSEVTGGLIGDMRNNTVDIAATGFLYTSGRAKYLKILSWYCSFRSICMFLNPTAAASELHIGEFLKPFSWTVWLIFGSLLLLAGFLLWLTFRLEGRFGHVSMTPSLLTSCLLSFGAACIQGAWILPNSTGGRMVFYAIMLSCFLIYNYYTSIVVSSLLDAVPKSNIRTIQQLADSNLEVSVEAIIYTKVYVETSDYPDVRSLYINKIVNSKREPQRIWLPAEEGVLMVRNKPGFVFIADAAGAYGFVRKHYLPHEICELNEILLRQETAAHTMVVKNSSYAEVLKLNFLRMMETGVHAKYYRYWIHSKLHCYQSNRTVVVGMDSAGPLFLLLIFAYTMSFQFAQQIYNHHHQLIYHQFVHLNQWTWGQFEERYLDHMQPTLAIYVDLKCMRARHLLAEASRTELFNQHYHWLLHDSSEVFNFYDFFEPMNISVDADVSYVEQQMADNRGDGAVFYRNYDVYNNGKMQGGQLNITGNYEVSCNQSNCNLSRHLSSLHLRSKYRHREQLTDVVLRVATVTISRPIDWPKEQLLRYLTQDNNTLVDGIARLGFRMCQILKDMLQCGWSITEIYGGAVGALANRSADIMSAPGLATSVRLKTHITAIIESGYFRSICLFRTPHNAGIRSDVFIRPFSALVWYFFGGILLMIGMFLWLTFYMECKRMRRSWRLSFVPSLLTTLLYSFGAACIQSSQLVPRSMGGRLAYLILLLTTFIMYNYYTSVVVSSLLSSPVKSDIKTMQQLAESSLTVGLEPLSFTKSYLNYSLRADIALFKKRKVNTQANNKDLWLPTEEGILRVRDNPGYVYIFETSAGYAYVERHYTQQEICDLNEILFRPELLAYTLLQRNSTYKELIRLRMLRVLETGVYRKHRSQWAHMKLHCFSDSFVITVGMEYVAPLFFILICGYILVLILLLLELAWHRYSKR
ncbi:GH14466 [Drosophila grimshawi]|uniref:Ionotropic receptor 75a n=1 Tax=Drosophila grimshawi TaxID=7222 RepID=B4J052_DROGR|nr:GH14466 [Drosophila grimshawi]